ncbi:BspA family leucine-rich repeat surface protein [Flagellimonas sp. HMM57]|uniref:BspA family leucine-rich repeat surface protein n=1 Tax=unclassified Flagellimonas TaxID=2644544 RepID=UPI0013D7E8D1|nr:MULTISPECIES: BspA family leucine-rich repeat surface protein [unclassified Flagellimonas]UII75973.1 BspA family leucine-rich repeat surface protein [Flagellimonas sp. HMM57]
MKKIHFLVLMMLSVGMFIISCSSDDNGTTSPTTVEKPTISGFTPSSGPVGTQVTINGTNFSTTPASNTVKIGNTTATVSVATTTKLTISVSQGATTGAVSVGVGGETVTGSTFTVTETEAQNTAPVITNQTTTTEVDEDANNESTIFTVTATDADADDTLTFEITDGNDEGLFSIDENGLITLAEGKTLDYETATEHSITVTVSDGNGGTAEITVHIAVQNVIGDLLNDPASFIFTLETVGANEEFFIKVYGEVGDVDFHIDWGDGQAEEHMTVQGDLGHQYETPGTYPVALKGQMDRLTFDEQIALRTVEQWGTTAWKSMEEMLYLNLLDDFVAINAKDNPNLDQCTSLENAFINADFKQDINGWDVDQVTNMTGTFSYNHKFNQDISSWDVSQVTNMDFMFFVADSFNQPIGANWDVGNVQSMYEMFFGTTAFDQDLGAWNIVNVTDMTGMLDDSGMSAVNFSNTILGWEDQEVQSGVKLGAEGVQYCNYFDVAFALGFLNVDHQWEITGHTPTDCD